MNCRRRGTAQAKKPDDPNKKGNGVQTYADKAGMERDNRPVGVQDFSGMAKEGGR